MVKRGQPRKQTHNKRNQTVRNSSVTFHSFWKCRQFSS